MASTEVCCLLHSFTLHTLAPSWTYVCKKAGTDQHQKYYASMEGGYQKGLGNLYLRKTKQARLSSLGRVTG